VPENYSSEAVQRAERLKCQVGHSFNEVNDITGNSLMQLEYPVKKLGWTKKGMRTTGTSDRDEPDREQDGTCMKATELVQFRCNNGAVKVQ